MFILSWLSFGELVWIGHTHNKSWKMARIWVLTNEVTHAFKLTLQYYRHNWSQLLLKVHSIVLAMVSFTIHHEEIHIGITG
jgi:hypothetical protein